MAVLEHDSQRLPSSFSSPAIEGHPLISRDGGELCRNADFRYESA